MILLIQIQCPLNPLNHCKSLIFCLLWSQKQNENESDSVILVFVLHHSHLLPNSHIKRISILEWI